MKQNKNNEVFAKLYNMNMESKFHVYIDEGGMFGGCTVCICNKKLKKSKNQDDISNYYFDKISVASLIRHLELFSIAFKKCNIKIKEII